MWKNPDHQLESTLPALTDEFQSSGSIHHLSSTTRASSLTSMRRTLDRFPNSRSCVVGGASSSLMHSLKNSNSLDSSLTLVVDPPSDITELFNCYDATITELLNKHAPWHLITGRIRPSTRWFEAECYAAKSTTKRFEKVHRRKPSSTVTAWMHQLNARRLLYQHKYTRYWSDTTI